jgi:hypothetical protein
MIFTPSGPSYKPFKAECRRQALQMKRSERIRFYFLALAIKMTNSVPVLPSLSPVACRFFSFMLKYLLTCAQEIPASPGPERFCVFLNASLNAVTVTNTVEELYLLVEEYIKFVEKSSYVYNTLTANPETLPVKSLEGFSHISLT